MADRPLAFLVEDDYDASVIFENALVAAGYRTEVVRDGTQAAARLGEIMPHLAVLDLHLPGVSGETLLEQIRADPRLGKVIVFISTADPQMASQLEDKADLVLIKPIEFGQLQALSQRFLPR